MNHIVRKILKVSRGAVRIALTVFAALTFLEDALASTALAQDLNFKLVGTAVVDGHEGSMAVVEFDAHRQALYRRDDRVGSVWIRQILLDRIIVEGRGGEKTIKLRHYLRADLQKKRSAAPLLHQSVKPILYRPTGSRSLQVVRLDQHTRESLLGEVDQSLNEVLVDPVIVYGQPVGVRINPIKPGSIFSEIGLKQGDVILEVKGKEVTEPEDAVALFELIGQGGEFDIKVKGRRTRRIHLITE